jgi:hypothetical protein
MTKPTLKGRSRDLTARVLLKTAAKLYRLGCKFVDVDPADKRTAEGVRLLQVARQRIAYLEKQNQQLQSVVDQQRGKITSSGLLLPPGLVK